jgi:MFS family permease
VRFSWKRTLVVGAAFLSMSVLWPVFNQFIPIFLQAGNPLWEQDLLASGKQLPQVRGFGLSPTIAFFIMTWDNLLNVFVQPWAGARRDHTWNRFGRRKPWIMVGAPIAIIAFVFIPLANTLLAIMVFIVVTNIGMALFRSPAVAWLGDLFPPEQRSKANGLLNLMGGVGAALALFGGGLLFDRFGRAAPFFGAAVVMALAILVAVRFVHEPETGRQLAAEAPPASVLLHFRVVWNAQNRSGFFVLLGILLWFMGFNAIETGLSSFAVFTLGMGPGPAAMFTTVFVAVFITCALPSGLLASRIGRTRTIRIGLVALLLLFGAGYALIRDELTLAFVLVPAGAAWALVNVNSLPLVYDTGDEGSIGAYTGLYYFASQTAAVFGPVLAGYAVELSGSHRVIFAFGAVFMLLAYIAMRAVSVPEQPQHV